MWRLNELGVSGGEQTEACGGCQNRLGQNNGTRGSTTAGIMSPSGNELDREGPATKYHQQLNSKELISYLLNVIRFPITRLYGIQHISHTLDNHISSGLIQVSLAGETWRERNSNRLAAFYSIHGPAILQSSPFFEVIAGRGHLSYDETSAYGSFSGSRFR